jgi:hypothetical protein
MERGTEGMEGLGEKQARLETQLSPHLLVGGWQVGPGEETPAGRWLDAVGSLRLNGGSIWAIATGIEVDTKSLPANGTRGPTPTPIESRL